MLDVEYIESGTFQGGEENASKSGIKPGDACMVLTLPEYIALLRKIADTQAELISELESKLIK